MDLFFILPGVHSFVGALYLNDIMLLLDLLVELHSSNVYCHSLPDNIRGLIDLGYMSLSLRRNDCHSLALLDGAQADKFFKNCCRAFFAKLLSAKKLPACS